ncbi:mRNA decay activator protein ZFP36 [Psilocybe cubensis]|uniref:C3H1-type domain-containing protein n=2 Tax=Psilocybe cubensis TaxID=181762 RepID=A0A8H8CRU9_PSICU|nr:mRNA decay activator protein ZFP36 [Psilocybe cubensis]KAH9487095.1 mRNA decay activator protein ZFP36 [Psilocybe cubensis]
MHDTVTNSSTTTSRYSDPSNDLFSSVSTSSRPSALKDSFGWIYPLHSDLEPSFENWKPSTPDTTIRLNSGPQSLQKPDSFIMPSRTNAENTDKASLVNGSRRWRVNSSGQLVDAGAESASWELADQIGRLKIGDVTADPVDSRVSLRTPPKTKIASGAVTQLAESSPLDSSSNTSVGSSPHVPDHQIAHSRGSSADTTISSSRDSIAGNALLSHPPLKGAPTPEAKERPHSFSGGLSTADLRRLQQAGDADHDRQVQQQQWAQNQYREHNAELSYPSLANQVQRPTFPTDMFHYPPNPQLLQQTDRDREAPQLDYNSQQQRNFGPVAPHITSGLVMNPMNGAAPPPPPFVQGRPNNPIPTVNYRQTPRSFPQQGPTPAGLGYGGAHHTSHLSLGNTQQLYEMMLPGPPSHENHHPAVTRVQQQHNVFRGTHHHSASDPSALRDVNTLQLLNNAMQPYNPNMFQPGLPPSTMPIYPNQFYAAPELAVQQVAMARLQAQYTGSYSVGTTTPNLEEIGSPTSSSGQTGPSANNRKLGLYKTELCRSWEEKGSCRYGAKCQFAHGEEELRRVSRHPKYKTEICKTFWVSGSCPYGKRCCFIHTELTPAPAAGGPVENTPPQPQADHRKRSDSDPDTSSSVSLLARISQRNPTDPPSNVASTPVEVNPTNTFQPGRPNSLRVDTSALEGASIKQNKSAYPSFGVVSHGIVLPNPEHISARSPAPVTAGPDLGRHNLARMEIVGFPNHQKKNSTSSSTSASNPRHSFSGTEGDFSASPPTSGHAFGSDSPQPGATVPTRVNGHVRAGSAGNWGSISRSNLSTSTSAYPHGSNAAGEIMSSNSPWSTTELSIGATRLHEKNWA